MFWNALEGEDPPLSHILTPQIHSIDFISLWCFYRSVIIYLPFWNLRNWKFGFFPQLIWWKNLNWNYVQSLLTLSQLVVTFRCKNMSIFDYKLGVYVPWHLSGSEVVKFLNSKTYLVLRFLDHRFGPILDNTTTSGRRTALKEGPYWITGS